MLLSCAVVSGPYWPSSLGRCSVSPSPSSVIGSLQTGREMKVGGHAHFLRLQLHHVFLCAFSHLGHETPNCGDISKQQLGRERKSPNYVNVCKIKRLNWIPQEPVHEVSMDTGWLAEINFSERSAWSSDVLLCTKQEEPLGNTSSTAWKFRSEGMSHEEEASRSPDSVRTCVVWDVR